MPERILPRYPVYVLSKSRPRTCITAHRLVRDQVPFRLVVEPAQVDEYREANSAATLLITPRDSMGATGVRNFIADHSTAAGDERHWQLDDNMQGYRRLYHGRRFPVAAGIALRVVEDMTDRYTNIGVSGHNYTMFVPDTSTTPYYLNCHVYSSVLIWNRMPYRWRLPLNDDTDLCLQVLSGGLCTLAVNVFNVHKVRTGNMRGGQAQLYHGHGRLKMAKTLERVWPHVVTTERRFGRAQHVIRGQWRGFDTPLIRRTDIDWDNLPAVDEYGMRLNQVADEIRSPIVQRLHDQAQGLQV